MSLKVLGRLDDSSSGVMFNVDTKQIECKIGVKVTFGAKKGSPAGPWR
jgi:hypothetical protein